MKGVAATLAVSLVFLQMPGGFAAPLVSGGSQQTDVPTVPAGDGSNKDTSRGTNESGNQSADRTTTGWLTQSGSSPLTAADDSRNLLDVYQYNKRGQVIVHRVYDTSTDPPTLVRRSTYTYVRVGNEWKEGTIFHYDGKGRLTGYSSSKYDTNGKLILRTVYSDRTSETGGRHTSYIQTAYYPSGRVRSGFIYSNTYNEAGKRVSSPYTATNAQGKPTRSDQYSYDPSGKLITSYIRAEYDPRGNVNYRYVSSYTYNEAGKRVSSTRRIVKHDQGKPARGTDQHSNEPSGRVRARRSDRDLRHFVIEGLRRMGFERHAGALEGREKHEGDQEEEITIFGLENKETTSTALAEEHEKGEAGEGEHRWMSREFRLLKQLLPEEDAVSVDRSRLPSKMIEQMVAPPGQSHLKSS